MEKADKKSSVFNITDRNDDEDYEDSSLSDEEVVLSKNLGLWRHRKTT